MRQHTNCPTAQYNVQSLRLKRNIKIMSPKAPLQRVRTVDSVKRWGQRVPGVAKGMFAHNSPMSRYNVLTR